MDGFYFFSITPVKLVSLVPMTVVHIHKNIVDLPFIHILGLKNKSTQKISAYVRASK